MKNSVYSIVPFAWTLKNNMCMFVCYHLCVCVCGGGIHICLYKHRLSLEGNTRKLFALAPRLARWAAGEQVHYILIWIFEFLYYVQVVLTKTFFFFKYKEIKKREPSGRPMAVARHRAPGATRRLCAGLQHPLLFASALCAMCVRADQAGDSLRERWSLFKERQRGKNSGRCWSRRRLRKDRMCALWHLKWQREQAVLDLSPDSALLGCVPLDTWPF